jgi:hypothetical protein
MSKQTAVEWLQEQLFPKRLTQEQYYCIEKAKEMEKEQIENTWIDATPRNIPKYEEITKEYAKQYYNETYKKAQ